MRHVQIKPYFVILALASPGLSAQTDTPAQSPALQIKPGMSAEMAIQLLGHPDQATEIGAACGMLEVLSWQGEQTKIIASDGVVSSVVTSNPTSPLSE